MQGFVPHLYQKLLNNTVKMFSFIEFFMPVIEIFLRRNFLLHFQHFLFQPILALQEGKSNSFWTRLRREGSEGSEGSKGSEGKVLKMDRPDGRRVLKFDGAFGPRVVVSPSQAMSMKSALRDWLYESYGMKSILLTGSLRSPPKGETAEWYMKYMTPCFSLHISRFPLRGSPAKRERVYGAEYR